MEKAKEDIFHQFLSQVGGHSYFSQNSSIYLSGPSALLDPAAAAAAAAAADPEAGALCGH